ncbi:MAG: polyphosphate polymerase domain-containing protein [Lachnospiraceae bacterium]|nr:polyphosphate polymerase domain-containing protein [Lachnospiraceae bacterium]MDD3794665.1 polyphosphate polymerase domain-containing protein [Lachnospiraceae bacterium]
MRKDREPHFRHEWKYLISDMEMDQIRRRLGLVLSRDAHALNGEYSIRSLYFDDYWDSSYSDKVMGYFVRKKYRIRIYNYSDRKISLERKIKVDSYIYKESAPLTREEYDQIMAGEYGFLEHSPHSLCREFYVECMCHVMRPRIIVDYEREPFIMEEGTVRITFDKRVRAAIGLDLFDEGLPVLDVFPPENVVLEVKYTEFLPELVRKVLPPAASEFMAISKYGLCYEKLQYHWDETYWCEERKSE